MLKISKIDWGWKKSWATAGGCLGVLLASSMLVGGALGAVAESPALPESGRGNPLLGRAQVKDSVDLGTGGATDKISVSGLDRGALDEEKKHAALLGEFVAVPGGCFQMGDSFGDGSFDERPVHEVCLDPFAIGKFEVTQGQWLAVMGKNPAYFKKGDNFPVEQVAWSEAQNFVTRLNEITGKNIRMPSEAEWEYAASSGGKKELYAGGDQISNLAWYDANSGSTPHAVGTKQPNGLGIYDMSGNVAEWVQDWYGSEYYSLSPRKNPVGQQGGAFGRVYRGGGWNTSPHMARTAKRDRYEPSNYFAAIGFRLAYSLK